MAETPSVTADEALAALAKVAKFAEPFVTLNGFVSGIASAEQALREANGRVTAAQERELELQASVAVLVGQRAALNREITELTSTRNSKVAKAEDTARARGDEIVAQATAAANTITAAAVKRAGEIGVAADAVAAKRDALNTEIDALVRTKSELTAAVEQLRARFK